MRSVGRGASRAGLFLVDASAFRMRSTRLRRDHSALCLSVIVDVWMRRICRVWDSWSEEKWEMDICSRD
jgi:hypothetical protein